MAIYEAELDEDEDGELIAVCPECEGTGKSDNVGFGRGGFERRLECAVCCGFGRLDW